MITFLEYVKKKKFSKKFIQQYGHFKVCVVNGKAVRDFSKEAEEFGEISIHPYFPTLIPKNEIWIEDNIKPKEQGVLIASALHQLKKIESGMSLEKAYEDGMKKQNKYREAILLSKKKIYSTNKSAPDYVYIKKYGHVENEDVDVWLVDGETVRNHFKVDYLEGGHGYVYGWIPNGEIWIEKSPHPNEWSYILLHEYVELVLMKYKKMGYDKAHAIASKCEWYMRKYKSNYSKKQALSLTKEKALELVRRNK
jgi:hypothetical protein